MKKQNFKVVKAPRIKASVFNTKPIYNEDDEQDIIDEDGSLSIDDHLCYGIG